MAGRKDPLAAARARLLRLKAQHDAGRLDDASYDQQRRAVEREIGERLLVGDASAGSSAAATTADAARRPSLGLVAGLAVAVLAVAAIGYWQTGSPLLARGDATSLAAAEPAANGASAPSGMQQIAAMVDQLAARMKEHPDDAEGWTMLGRSYTVLGRFADALPAYRRASELQPKNAGLLADYADAVAATKQTANNPESIALIDRALAVEPNHPKALALAGTVAYDRGDYAGAVASWQKVADQLPPGSELVQQVQASIDEARQRGGPNMVVAAPARPASTAIATSGAPKAVTGSTAPAAAGATSVAGVVTLDPSLAAQAAPGDSVFVFARAAQGGRMPLAVLRAKVSDLPLTFKLDDSMAMAPGMTISSANALTVGARISKSGNAIPQPGDLSGEASNVAPGAKNLAIRIGSVVGKP